MVPKPKKEGVHATLTCDARGFIPKTAFPLRASHTLADLQQDYVLFTPAILYLHGQFRDAPLADFVNFAVPDAKFEYVKLNHPVFSGLEAKNGDPTWNYVLWLMPKAHWDVFLPWMTSITLMSEASQQVARIASQCVSVRDMRAELPTFVDVFVFALDTNTAQIAMLPDPACPRLTRLPPQNDVQLFAAALYNGLNPLDIVAQAQKEKT